MTVRCGYACISQPLRAEGVFTNRTLRAQTFREKGLDYVRGLVLSNLADLRRVVLYNETQGYRFFRMSSEMFPHLGNDLLGDIIADYNIDFARPELADIGATVRALGHRVTFHPGQFAQLGSPSAEVVMRTVRDLTQHADIFAAMGMKPEHGSVMIIHGGGTYGDKELAGIRFEQSLAALPESVRQYIALENDETQWSVADLLPICERNKIPLCVDFFHHQCMFGRGQLPSDDLLDRVNLTWTTRGIKQKVHMSSQKIGARVGTHDDYIRLSELPPVLALCRKYSADIMCECKQKDLCLQKVLDKFFVKEHTGGEHFYWRLKDNIEMS